tara:strand:- start:2785 stop:3429 length:645 start_codon:yes stop_codon:yes gene_type:complete
MAGLGLDKDFLNVSIVNANENIFIRGESGAANQVISYDADRRIQFTDIPNDNDNIAVSNPITKSVVGDTHTIGLGFETTDFQLSASNKLELKDDFVKTASNPLSVSTQNVSLNFNTGDFQLDGSNKLELKDDFVKTASSPLSISTGNISINLSSLSGVETIVVDSYAGLSIKYGTTTSFKIDSSGGISMFGLPTSNYGLASGRIWNKGGALNIV